MNVKEFLKGLTDKEQRDLLKELTKTLRKPIIKRVKPVIKKIKPRILVISKRSLGKSVREGLTDKQLADKFKVSERTISRRIKEYNLKGLRPYGKRLLKPEWILTSIYIKRIKRIYRPIYTQTPNKRYINTKDKICSNNTNYPKEKYFSFSTYFVVNYDGVRQIFMRAIQYSEKSMPFKEIKEYALRKSYEILSKMFYKAPFWIEEIIAYEFLTKKEHSLILPEFKTSLISKEEKNK
jgi:hypothetical protein